MLNQQFHFLKHVNLVVHALRFHIAIIFLLSLLCQSASGQLSCGQEYSNMTIGVRSGVWSIPGTTFKMGGGPCYWGGR